MRLLVGKLCIVLAKSLTHDEVVLAVLPSLHTLMKDAAWRVRFVIADKFCELQAVVGPAVAGSDLLPAFIALLGDGESEVRAAASSKVVDFCRDLPEAGRVEAVLTGVLPQLQALVADDAQHVREALAAVVMGLAEIVGKDHTINFLIPLFLTLLKDQFSEVRLKIISNLDAINKGERRVHPVALYAWRLPRHLAGATPAELGVGRIVLLADPFFPLLLFVPLFASAAVVGIGQLAQALEPAINELFTDENWRVRIATIELIPLVAKQLGVTYFDQELSAKFLESLLDRIFSVRAATIDNIAKLVEYFGIDWAKASLFPRILGMPAAKNTYAARLVTLLAINVGLCTVLFCLPALCVRVPRLRLQLTESWRAAKCPPLSPIVLSFRCYTATGRGMSEGRDPDAIRASRLCVRPGQGGQRPV